MKHHLGPVVVLCLTSACVSEPSKADAEQPSNRTASSTKTDAKPPSDRVAPPTKIEDGGAAEPEAVPPEPEPRAAGERWRSTAAEAKAAGLPPLAFSFDLGNAGMIGSRFSDGTYATLSGPPGGTLMLRVSPATVGADPAGLVRRESAATTPQTVELLGAKRPAVAWVSGAGMARTSWCGIIVAPAGATEGAPALLVELGVGHYDGEPACTPTVEDDLLGPMVKSLKLE